MKQQTRREVMRLGAGAVALLGPARLARAAEFYAGKTIEIIVPFAEGGAADVTTRFLTPFLMRHLPGKPQITIRNLGGGGSILGANQFQKAGKADGLLVLSTTSSSAFPYILKQQGVEYDLSDKRVGYAIGIGPVVYAAPATGVEKPADLKQPKVPLVYGGIGATASDLPVLLAFELLGLDVKSVLGFQGRGPIRLAFERGETNLDFQFTSVYLTQVRPQVEAKKAVPLMTGGASDAQGRFTARDPVIGDLPSVYEVYKTIMGKEPSGPVWGAYESAAALTFEYGVTGWMPAGTPQEAIDAFAAAAAAINADPEFQSRGKQVTGGYKLQDGKAIEAKVKAALAASPEVANFLREFLTRKYGVKL